MNEIKRNQYPKKRGSRQSYTLLRDFVIPAGTDVFVEPAGMTKTINIPFASITVELGKDSTAEWSMPLDEALRLGLIAEADKKAA